MYARMAANPGFYPDPVPESDLDVRGVLPLRQRAQDFELDGVVVRAAPDVGQELRAASTLSRSASVVAIAQHALAVRKLDGVDGRELGALLHRLPIFLDQRLVHVTHG